MGAPCEPRWHEARQQAPDMADTVDAMRILTLACAALAMTSSSPCPSRDAAGPTAARDVDAHARPGHVTDLQAGGPIANQTRTGREWEGAIAAITDSKLAKHGARPTNAREGLRNVYTWLGERRRRKSLSRP